MYNKTTVLTVLAANLAGGDDNLSRVGVADTLDRVAQNADSTDELASPPHLLGIILSEQVLGARNNHLGLDERLLLRDKLILVLQTGDNTVLVDDVANISVERILASPAGSLHRETLGNLTEAVVGEYVRRRPVDGHGAAVEQNTLNGLPSGLVQVLIISVKGHGVADKVRCCSINAVLLVKLTHSNLVKVVS